MVREYKEVVAPKRTTRSYSSMEKSEGSQNLEYEVGIVKVNDKLQEGDQVKSKKWRR